jgi:hypothetical protein
VKALPLFLRLIAFSPVHSGDEMGPVRLGFFAKNRIARIGQ